MILWRISNFEDLLGIGGLHAPGRWHHKGREVVYLAESPAGALLEVLVHFECAPADVPATFKLLEIALPDDVTLARLDDAALAPDWRNDASATRDIGDQWLASGTSLLLKVPSAVIPASHNYLFNPRHPGAGRATIRQVVEHPYDRRLFSRQTEP